MRYWSIIILISIIFLAVAFWGWWGFGCDDEIQQKVDSPNGKFEAVVYYRDCGATTSIATHVGIKRNGLFSEFDSVLVIDGKPVIALRWIGNEALEVESNYPLLRSNDDIYTFKENFDGIRINYISLKKE